MAITRDPAPTSPFSPDHRAEPPGSATQDDLLGLVGYAMKRAFIPIRADLKQCLKPLGLTQRSFSVLSVIAENPGVSQSVMARTLGIERSGAVPIVDRLEADGLIRRQRVAGDRRPKALHVTRAGAALYDRALAAARAHEGRMLASLDSGEIETLHRLLRRLNTAAGID